MTPLLQIAVGIGLVSATVAAVLAAWRVLAGPTVPDRAVGADMVATCVIGLIALSAIRLNSLAFVDVALMLAILSFLATVAVAKYIAKGVIIERDADS